MLKVFLTSFFFSLFMVTGFYGKSQNLAVTNILYPTTALNCSVVPRTDSVVVRISNLGAAAITNFDISYSLNNGSVITETYTGTPVAAAGGFINYIFNTKLNTLTGGVNSLKAFTSLPLDIARANDTTVLTYIPRVQGFPYYENFESNNGGFSAGGTNSTWVWGARNKVNTGGSADGTMSWTNGGLNGYYANSDFSFLRSPCYDFTNLKNPYMAFQFVLEVENGYESVVLEYSINGGASFAPLGSSADLDNCDTKNWFNSGSSWTGNNRSYPCSFGWGFGCNGRSYCGAWAEARHCLNFLAGQPSVIFQWRFNSSGTQCTADGFALDSLVLGEAPQLSPLNVSSPAIVCQNEPAFFNPTIASCYKTPRWDFGDTSPVLSNLTAVHAFKNPGTYTVKFMVTGLCGKVDTLFKQITVLPAPVTSITPFGNLCRLAMPVPLNATPAGGVFYIDGVKKDTIDPSALAMGTHYVVYEYKDPGPGGCTATDTIPFEIYLPVVTIDNLGGQYCPSAPSFKLKGTPAGGTFLIDGNPDSIFNPSVLGLGTHTVTYVYQDSVGCPASISQTTDINNSLSVTLSALNATYCAGAPEVQLSGMPAGGVFYVNGVVTSRYNPSALAVTPGIDTVVYFYSDGSCSNADTAFVDVIKNTPVISGINPLYCYNAPAVSLSATPAGGVFTLDGSPLANFDPKNITAGNHRLVYTYQDPVYTTCIDSAVISVTIDKPVAKINGLLPNYCIDADEVILSATPAGGSFTLDNNSATSLDPSVLGLGDYKIVYTYTNGNGCIARDSQQVKIVDLPALQFTGLVKNLCFNSNPQNINTNPTGGSFSINGLPVNGSTFDPSLYDAGKYHVLKYTFVDFTYGCVNSIDDSIFIGTPPAVAINGLNTQYCSSDEVVTLKGTPSGGQFTVNGVNNTTLDIQSLGAGTHTVKYSYTDANGCSNEIDQLVDIITNPGDTIFPGPVVEICRGESILLQVNGSLPGIWSTNETTSSITVQPAVTTDYWYKVNDCASYFDSVKIIVNARPLADFEISPDQGFSPLLVTVKNKTTNISGFNWIFEDGKTDSLDPAQYTYEAPGQFMVKLAVVNADGCVDTLEKMVTVYEGITIPNVFSPNGDYINDHFGPVTAGTFSRYSFKVFNRWGNLVFEGSRPEDRWDGNYNGNPVPDGTYFYILIAENLKEFKLEGSVTLVR